jgi:threonine dehydrogenase-like Zn-dependent dehydrogenase
MRAALNVVDAVLGQRETEAAAIPDSGVERMRAIVWKGKQEVDYEEVPKPLLSEGRDVIVRVTATTICGSDLHLISGAMPTMKAGDILGHEFMGIVTEVGEAVTTIKRHDRVVVSFDIACGQCDFCERGEFTACKVTNPSNLQMKLFGQRTAALFGYSHLTGGIPGGQAEFVRVPFADVNCLVVPDSVPDESALFLSDIVPTSYFGTEMAEVKKGD